MVWVDGFLFQGAIFRFHFHNFSVVYMILYLVTLTTVSEHGWHLICVGGAVTQSFSHIPKTSKNATFPYSKFPPLTCWYQNGLDRGGNGKATTGCRSTWAMKPSLAMQARVAFSSVENYSPKTKTDTWKPWNNLTMTRSMFCEGIIFLFFLSKQNRKGCRPPVAPINQSTSGLNNWKIGWSAAKKVHCGKGTCFWTTEELSNCGQHMTAPGSLNQIEV